MLLLSLALSPSCVAVSLRSLGGLLGAPGAVRQWSDRQEQGEGGLRRRSVLDLHLDLHGVLWTACQLQGQVGWASQSAEMEVLTQAGLEAGLQAGSV